MTKYRPSCSFSRVNALHLDRLGRVLWIACLAILLPCTQGMGMHLHLHDHDHAVAAAGHTHPDPIHLSHFGEAGGHASPLSEIDIPLDSTLKTPLSLAVLLVALVSAMGVVGAAASHKIPIRESPPARTPGRGVLPLRRGPPRSCFSNKATK